MVCFLMLIILALFMNTPLPAKGLSSRNSRSVVRDRSRLWPKGIVYYTIDSAYTYPEYVKIRQAMKDIQSFSCIQFRWRTDEKGYVKILKREGCSAHVGYLGYPQEVNLDEGCVDPSVILHEFFHMLGFFHEHNRPDRDDHIFVDKNNIDAENLGAFKKKTALEADTLGLPYDIKSLLHYDHNVFAIDHSKPNIISKAGITFSVPNKKLSAMDILKLNMLYRCSRN